MDGDSALRMVRGILAAEHAAVSRQDESFEIVRRDHARARIEADPNGRDPHTPGAKLDAGKLDLTLPPPALVEAVARVMQHGVEKYARNGWREVPDAGRRYYAALKRHLHAFERGEDVDPDSGLHHLDHAATNIAFLLWFLQQGREIGEWR